MTTKTGTVTRRVATAARSGASAEGIVKAIVAVTGTIDEVGDLIMPGSFAATLSVRRPKVVFHHDFRDFVGRVLHIEEWAPGDPRLPKTTPQGLPWPAAAGALVATMQFNMATERGREVFEWVRFFHANREAAWSIGYKVPAGRAVKRADGVRVIYGIDLYELSVVLHGAHTLATTLETKSVKRPRLEHKGNDLTGAIVTPRPRAPMEAKTAALVVTEAKSMHNAPTVVVATPPEPNDKVDEQKPAGEEKGGLAHDPVTGLVEALRAALTPPAPAACSCGGAAPVVAGPGDALGGVAKLIESAPMEAKELTRAIASPLNALFEALGSKGVDVAGVMLDPDGVLLDLEGKSDRDEDEAADLIATRDPDTRPGADVDPKPGDLIMPDRVDRTSEDDLEEHLLEHKGDPDDEDDVVPTPAPAADGDTTEPVEAGPDPDEELEPEEDLGVATDPDIEEDVDQVAPVATTEGAVTPNLLDDDVAPTVLDAPAPLPSGTPPEADEEPVIDPDTGLPVREEDDDMEGKARVVLDPALVRAQLDALDL